MKEVALNKNSLDTSDVFILDLGLKIFQVKRIFEIIVFYCCDDVSGMDRQAIKMNDTRLYNIYRALRVSVEESHKLRPLVYVIYLTIDKFTLCLWYFLDSREVSANHEFMKALSDEALEDDDLKSDSDTFVKSMFR